MKFFPRPICGLNGHIAVWPEQHDFHCIAYRRILRKQRDDAAFASLMAEFGAGTFSVQS